MAADTWQRLDPWQRRLTRFVVTKTYAPVGAGGLSDRPALRPHRPHARSLIRLNEAIVEPVQVVSGSVARHDRTVRAAGVREVSRTDPLGLKLVAPTGI